MTRFQLSRLQKNFVLKRQSYKCAMCDKQLRPLGSVRPVFGYVEPLALGGPSRAGNAQALCPDCNAIKTKKDKVRIADEKKRVKANEQKIDEFTPTLSVFRAAARNDLKMSPLPGHFYWDIVVHNVGPGKAVAVNVSAANSGGKQVASYSTPLLKVDEEVRVPVVYDPLGSESWNVKVGYSDMRKRKYADVEVSFDNSP